MGVTSGRSPDWRDEAAAALLLKHLSLTPPAGPLLLMGESRPELEETLAKEGVEVASWTRRAFGGRRATPWPPEGPFQSATLRLPRAKEELEMALHGAALALAPGGSILVYGAKDEGIGSVARRLHLHFEKIETMEVGGHCRIIGGRRKAEAPPGVSGLARWRETSRLVYGPLDREWVSYPGIFAHGHLDEGTRLLLDSLPSFPDGSRVLDYGCGSGVIGAVVGMLYPMVRLELLDVDAVAVEAARENLQGVRVLLGDGLPDPSEDPFHCIVSNPPFHRGKAEEPEMVLQLIREAPKVLSSKGGVVLVSQKRLPLESALQDSFGEVSLRGEKGAFRVWEGWLPRWS